MTDSSVPTLGPTAESTLETPNLVLLAVILFILMASQCRVRSVDRLVIADQISTQRIAELEQQVADNPRNGFSALELARLYRRSGEFPWSYDALRTAEQHGPSNPGWRMRLGLAYLEMGRNTDGRRVLKQLVDTCDLTSCPPHVEVKLRAFAEMAETFLRDGLDARHDHDQINELIRRLIKPIKGTPPAATEPKAGARGAKPDDAARKTL